MKRRYTIPAGRLAPGDTVYVEGERYGVIDHITVPAHPADPFNDGAYWITYDVVLVTFKCEGTSVADTPWSLIRLPYEMVNAELGNNLKTGKTALDLPMKRTSLT